MHHSVHYKQGFFIFLFFIFTKINVLLAQSNKELSMSVLSVTGK